MPFKFQNLGRDLRDAILHVLRDYSEALILAVIFAFILRSFVISTYKITNLTMEPTLRLGDFLIGYRLPYGITVPFTNIHYGQTTPRRGDLVVFRCPDQAEHFCVKRVVAIGGDRVEIRKQHLIINGHMAHYSLSHVHVSPVIASQARVVALNEKVYGEPTHTILISNQPSRDFGPYIVPPHSFFALSDNRDFSEDSRYWGAIPDRDIEARIVLIALSFAWHKQQGGGYTSRLREHRMFQWVQ